VTVGYAPPLQRDFDSAIRAIRDSRALDYISTPAANVICRYVDGLALRGAEFMWGRDIARELGAET